MENEEMINTIRSWVKLDNEMRTLKDEIAKRKKLKDGLSSKLLSTMKQKDIDSFDLNNGKIEHITRKTKKPISKKLLLNILSNYYNGDTNKAKEINSYILENREETSKELIVRKIDKLN